MAKVPSYYCLFCEEHHPKYVTKCPRTGKDVPEVYRLEGYTIDGKYKVEAKIAEGGMGIVYEGTQISLGRKVAIKFLHSDLKAKENIILRFQNEARLAASIGHRNIVDIIDMGRYRAEIYYIVMEYLNGQDLDQILEDVAKLTQREAVDLTIQILSGLRAAHHKGVIHRDLKPANIFIVSAPGEERYVKILDFGVSRLIDEEKITDVRVTRSGAVFGTPRYMSPEQARGKHAIDQRADLYSVGAMLYQMLCSEPPFTSESLGELMADIITEAPVPLLARCAYVSPDLSLVVMKSIAKAPEDRFQSGQEFIEALSPFSSSPVFRKTSTGEIVYDPESKAMEQEPSVQLKLDDRILSSSLPFSEDDTEEDLSEYLSEPFEGSKDRQDLVHVMETLPPGKVSAVDESDVVDEARETGPRDSVPADIDAAEPRAGAPADNEVSQETPPGRAVLQEAAAPKRDKRRFIYVSIVLVFLVIVAAVVGVRFIRGKPGHGGENTIVNESTAQEEKAPQPARIFIENLPDGAKVYVDDVYYPDHPAVVKDSGDPRDIRVVLDGKELMHEKIMIRKDTSIPFTYRKEVEAGPASEKETDQKTHGAKKVKTVPAEQTTRPVKKSPHKPSKKKKKEIDEEFPTGIDEKPPKEIDEDLPV